MLTENKPDKYFLNSNEMCLVGVKKYPSSKGVEY